MELVGLAPVASRRTVVGLILATMLSVAVPVGAQQPPAQAPAAPPADAPPPPVDPFKFPTAPAAIIMWFVKAEATADFEAVWAEIKTKLGTSGTPDNKAVVDALKIYKAGMPATPQGVMYFVRIEPVAPTTSYGPLIAFEAKGADGMPLWTRAEAQALFDKLNAASAGINPIPLEAAK